MLTPEMNTFLTRTGPGTPMGELFRRYWIPALLDWELPERDCPPVRVKLLGERLIAFRDTEGRIGIIDEFCAHRGVSLWFGRNEECGLRCSYHGWKYDVNGQCGDLATDPFHRNTAGAKFAKSTNTTFHILDSAGGLIIGARRDADPGNHYWRITQWIMPWYTLIPPYAGNAANGHAWVPMDDENCMAWSMTFHPAHPIPEEHLELIKDGNGVHAELIPGTFRPVANRSNDYLIDRAKQNSGRHYNAVKGLAMQDASVQESMGPIADRTKENLRSTDRAIIIARQRLVKAGKEIQKGGKAPGLSAEAQLVRSASFVIPVEADFEEHALDAVKYREGAPHVAV